MTKGRLSLTYTPLHVESFSHHGPPDPDAVDATLSLGLSSPNVVTGRSGAITTGRKRKKGYSKFVSQKKELRRERRAKSGRKKDVVAGEEGDNFKENLGKNSRRAFAADANINDWDEVISSPEKEFVVDTKKSQREAKANEEEDANAPQESVDDVDSFGGTVEFHVDPENNDEGEDEDTTVGEESGDDDASDSDPDSPLTQKRLFPSSSTKKRRVIQEEEDESSQDSLSVIDIKGAKKDTLRANSKAKKGGKNGATAIMCTTNTTRRTRKGTVDDDFSDDAEMKEIDSQVVGTRRRSKRLEETQVSSITNHRDDGDVLDEDSENEFTLTSDSLTSKKKTKSTSSSALEGHTKASKTKKVEHCFARADTREKARHVDGNYLKQDESTCSNNKRTANERRNKVLKSKLVEQAQLNGSHQKNHLDEDSFGSKVSKRKVAKHPAKANTAISRNCNDDGSSEDETKVSKIKMRAKMASSRSVHLKKVNPFVERANAKYAAAEAARVSSLATAHGTRSNDAKTTEMQTKKRNGVDFAEGSSPDDDVSLNDDASEYQPTQGDDKKVEVPKRSPRPSRRSSSRIIEEKEAEEARMAPEVAPRRRKKSGWKKNATGSKVGELADEATNLAKLDNDSEDRVVTKKNRSKKSKSYEKKSSALNNGEKKGNQSIKGNLKKQNSFDFEDNHGESLNFNGLDVEYHDETGEGESVYPSMLLTQAAASQFMEQSVGSSTAGVEGDNQTEEYSSDATHRTGNAKLLNSIQLNTRSIANPVPLANIEKSVETSKKPHDGRSQRKKYPTMTGTSSDNNKFTSSIKLTTRGIINMDPNAFFAAIQTQPQTESRSQHSSAVSPETNLSTANEHSGNEEKGDVKVSVRLESQSSGVESRRMSPEEMAEAMETMAQYAFEIRKICDKVKMHLNA